MGLYILKYPYRRILQPLARSLSWVHPDILSYLATVITVGTAACYLLALNRPTLLLFAVGLTLLRMTLNTLDGVIAIQRGNLSLKGEIVNTLPDRFSDIFLVLGIAMSSLCRPALGMLGLSSMLLVSYAGMLGKALGVEWQHHGPLGKVERLILVMGLSLFQYQLLCSGSTGWQVWGGSLTPLELCMLLFALLGPLTIWNRTRGMLRQIARLEWRKRDDKPGRPRVLVAYDSRTGNTQKVAGAIAESMWADLRRVDEVADLRPYDMVVIGSPVISSKPTAKVARFLRDHPELDRYAVFVTYGAPVIGPGKVRKALACFTDAVGKAPLAVFRCKGRHALVNTYRTHPDDADLLDAFLFGAKLAQASAGRA